MPCPVASSAHRWVGWGGWWWWWWWWVGGWVGGGGGGVNICGGSMCEERAMQRQRQRPRQAERHSTDPPEVVGRPARLRSYTATC